MTVTPAVAPVTFGTSVDAVIVAEPEFAPFTGTTTDVALAAKDTDAATEATAGLLELKETLRPAAGAGDERVSSRFCEPGALIASDGGEKLSAALTCTNWLAEV